MKETDNRRLLCSLRPRRPWPRRRRATKQGDELAPVPTNQHFGT
jgi:hypothetical protein